MKTAKSGKAFDAMGTSTASNLTCIKEILASQSKNLKTPKKSDSKIQANAGIALPNQRASVPSGAQTPLSNARNAARNNGLKTPKSAKPTKTSFGVRAVRQPTLVSKGLNQGETSDVEDEEDETVDIRRVNRSREQSLNRSSKTKFKAALPAEARGKRVSTMRIGRFAQ